MQRISKMGPKDLRKHSRIMREIGRRPEVRAFRARTAKKQHEDPKYIRAHARAMRRAWKRNRKSWARKISQSYWRHQNKIERLLKAQGWKVLRRGWPDFICIKRGSVKLVEAKGRNWLVTKEQLEVHKILKRHGFKVEVLRP